MVNEIIIAVLLILVCTGIRSGTKHFKGRGGCCGGSSQVRVKKKKLKNIIGHKRVLIEGMTCEHCKNRVENALNSLEGASAKVNLKKKTAVVSVEKEVEDMQIQKAVEQAGYKVIQIQ